jgi:hypothetical protein
VEVAQLEHAGRGRAACGGAELVQEQVVAGL